MANRRRLDRLLHTAALVALLGGAACGRPSLEGTWAGRDDRGAAVVYSFGPRGTGFYAIGSAETPLTYRLHEGYPNLLEIVVGADGTDVRRGLVEITRDGRMRMELGPSGGPPPPQLSHAALVLRQPATR